MFVALLLLLASCGPVTPGGADNAEPRKDELRKAILPKTIEQTLREVEQTLRECEAIDRDVAETLKRADDLFRLLGVTPPKLAPVPRPDLLPNVPKK